MTYLASLVAALSHCETRRRQSNTFLLVLILFLGIGLRGFQFPNIPPGLYADEAGVGYEAFSLLHTGADRWGIHWPVYFISWGSGQSVLYSYLSMPFLSALGLNTFSVRLLSLFVGILTLPVAYVAVKRSFGEDAALISTLLVAILPWHIMISRWALDANLLPFFLLLGTYTVTRALDGKHSMLGQVIALIPWGLSLYAYAIACLVVPVMLLLVFVVYRRTILQNWHKWLAALGIFALLAAPIGLFLLKNFLLHGDLGVESWLPFGVPLLPASRLAEVSSPLPDRLVNNALFLINGFQDGEIRNGVPGIAPAFWIAFPLALVGAARLLRSGRERVFLLWLVACLPLVFLMDLAINRINAIFLPMLVVAVYGFLSLRRSLHASQVFQISVAVLIAIQAVIFTLDYFVEYPTNPDTQLAFFQGFDRALAVGIKASQPTEPILVSDKITLPYVLTAFFAQYPPELYPEDARYVLEYGSVQVRSLGRFYFGLGNMPEQYTLYTYVLMKADAVPCVQSHTLLETRLWKVGTCNAE